MTRMDEPGGARRKAGALDRCGPLIGPGAGVLLGAATAFFLAAMPPRILSRLIDMTGLPAEAANGQGLLALGVAAVVGVATWALFLLLDRKPAPRARPLAIGHVPTPVLRRADAHPDAPACRPIFAGSDLGPPLDEADWQVMAGEGFTPLDTLELTVVIDSPAAPAAAPVIPPAVTVAPERSGDGAAADGDSRPPGAVGGADPVSSAMPTGGEPDAAVVPATVLPAAPRAGPPHPPPAPGPSGGMAASGNASPLIAEMARLEAALTRKALAPDDDAANVTPLRPGIRPVEGGLRAAIAAIERRLGGR